MDTRWLAYKNIEFDAQLFLRGLIRVRSAVSQPSSDKEASNSFNINGREFSFFSASPSKLDEKNEIAASSSAPSLPQQKKPDASSFKKATLLLSEMAKDTALGDIQFNQEACIFNTLRREEVFLPLVFKSKKQRALGHYVFPWLSINNSKAVFSGINQFVTAGCMFGPNLQARDQHGYAHPLIKHDIQFFDKQKIGWITYDPKALNHYEQMVFVELEKLCCMIDLFSKPEAPKELLFHLPYYDYILFGVELFIRGRMTFSALENFFQMVLEKKASYTARVEKICKRHNINVTIKSPFDNLFDPSRTDDIKSLLSQLELSSEEIDGVDECQQKENEKKLVKECLLKLKTNSFDEKLRGAWEDFLNIYDQEKEINDLEALFKLANTIMVAMISKGHKPNEVCSLLPLSEKQIQVNYQTYCKKFSQVAKGTTLYPSVVNLTTLDSLITYSPTSKGLPFYFDLLQEASTLAKVMQSRKLLTHAAQNTAFFAKSYSSSSSSNIKEPLEYLEPSISRLPHYELEQLLKPKDPDNGSSSPILATKHR